MRHRKKGKILDRKKQAREMMLRNLAASIIIFEKVRTTEAKAKAVRPLVERIITTAKKGDLTARRSLLSVLPQKKAVEKALVLGKKYEKRPGGYTRMIKLGYRPGDGAPVVQIEFV